MESCGFDSGSRLDRPALDRLRDAARAGEFDVVAVSSPDRRARRYAYQVLRREELRKAGCDVAFVPRPISDDPSDPRLLQIQGAVAASERAVLGERFRRGKLPKARAGHGIAGPAPSGDRDVPARDGVPVHESPPEDAKAHRARNSTRSFRNNTRHDYLLRCLLTCRTCGLARFGITTHDGHGRMHCDYKCHGKDTVMRDRSGRCTPTPAKVDELDAAVGGPIQALLEDPAALAARFEELARASEARDDGGAAVRRGETPRRRLDREEPRLLDASQAEGIDQEALRDRRGPIQGRRQVRTTQRDQEPRWETSGDRPNCRLRSDGVRPADLAPRRDDPLGGAEPVAGDDLAVPAPQHRLGHDAGTVPGAGEHRRQRRHGRPQPDPLAVLAPRRLIL